MKKLFATKLFFLIVLSPGCSAENDAATLGVNSSKEEIAREAAALEKKAAETAVSVEAETNQEISAGR